MSGRFEMAEALVRWAGKRFKELAPHQHEAFQTGNVTTDFRIAIKEVLEHLRSALEYSAREACERAAGGALPAETKTYFPIVGRGFDPKAFRSRVGKLLPGVLTAREDLVDVLASFQEFSSPEKNAWLPDFATLCNENKHERLSLQRQTLSPGEVGITEEGMRVYTLKRSGGVPFTKGFFFGFMPDPRAPGKGVVRYFRFDVIDYEVNGFLEVAMDGVGRIVKELGDKA